MLSRWLTARREAQERVKREAGDLITFLGAGAYHEARGRARAYREQGEGVRFRFWTQVALEIAAQTGHEVGSKTEDRRAADLTSPDALRRASEVRRAVHEIAANLAAIARGAGDATTLHNIRARALLAAELAGPAAQETATALFRAAAALEAAQQANAEALASGVCPAALDAAGKALERFRKALA